MRAWTIQTTDVAELLEAGGTWRAHSDRVAPHWQHAYRWMHRQMQQRLGPPSLDDQFPVWIWPHWRGRTRARPDLRCAGHLPPGSPGVRIELQLAPERVLLSDFELWHYVLNGWYLPRSRADERRHETIVDRDQVEASWQRIFDLRWSHPRYASPAAEKSVQGTLWELRPEDVRRMEHFVAR